MKDIKEKLLIIENACEDKKGIDIETIYVGDKTSIADYFVVVSGNSSSQVGSIADEVEEKMAKEAGEIVSHKEGYRSGRWVLLDFKDIVVHVFHKDEREFYALEKLWTEEK